MSYEINFGNDFSEHEWQVESKGWLDVKVSIGSFFLQLSFYDPTRLAQEIKNALSRSGLFFERNIIVIPAISRANVEKAVELLSKSGDLQRLGTDFDGQK